MESYSDWMKGNHSRLCQPIRVHERRRIPRQPRAQEDKAKINSSIVDNQVGSPSKAPSIPGKLPTSFLALKCRMVQSPTYSPQWEVTH